MSTCGISLGGADYDGSAEFYTCENVKARKDHRCEECWRVIPKGEKYERTSMKFDGDVSTIKTCIQCAEIRDAFRDPEGEFIMGELWEQMREKFSEFTTGCLQELVTPEAKRFVLDKWRKWKGLEKC